LSLFLLLLLLLRHRKRAHVELRSLGHDSHCDANYRKFMRQRKHKIQKVLTSFGYSTEDREERYPQH